jgi:uncharacterized membrane protein
MRAGQASMVSPSRLTLLAVFVMATSISASALFLLWYYGSLPWLLPVHFLQSGRPDGWQYKTVLRVFLPVLVQIALAATLGGIGGLLLSRRHGVHDADAPDVKAASAAAEAVMITAAIWIAFQGYAAYALVVMWAREFGALGPWYVRLEWIGALLTTIVGIRAHRRLGHPEPRPFVAGHWRFGELYKNSDDPALFVPTRNGARWTLNFGRPLAAALLCIILTIGITAPVLILTLSLR